MLRVLFFSILRAHALCKSSLFFVTLTSDSSSRRGTAGKSDGLDGGSRAGVSHVGSVCSSCGYFGHSRSLPLSAQQRNERSVRELTVASASCPHESGNHESPLNAGHHCIFLHLYIPGTRHSVWYRESAKLLSLLSLPYLLFNRISWKEK